MNHPYPASATNVDHKHFQNSNKVGFLKGNNSSAQEDYNLGQRASKIKGTSEHIFLGSQLLRPLQIIIKCSSFVVSVALSLTMVVTHAESLLDLNNYEIVFEDEFDDDTVDEGKWAYRTGGRHWSIQYEENVIQEDGVLKILLTDIRTGDVGVTLPFETIIYKYGAGGIRSKQDFKYGYYECRAKLIGSAGWHSAFWLMNSSINATEPYSGNEIDIFEVDSKHPNLVDYALHLHYPYVSNVALGKYDTDTGSDTTEYHTYGVEWTPTEVIWYFDGNETCRRKLPYPHIPLNIWLTSIASWLGGTSPSDIDAARDAVLDAGDVECVSVEGRQDKIIGEIEFDYVRYYQKKEDNIAIVKIPEADSSTGSHSSDNAVDNNPDTYWAPAPEATGAPHWIKFDLGKVYNVYAIRLDLGNAPANSYEVEYLSGSEWEKLLDQTTLTNPGGLYSFQNVTARYWRFNSSVDSVKLAEFTIYGNPERPDQRFLDGIIVDNDEAYYTESSASDWHVSSLPGYNSSSTRYSNVSGAWAKWELPLKQAGYYKVSVMHPINSNNTDDAEYTVKDATGRETTISIDQQISAAESDGWTPLSSDCFRFNATDNDDEYIKLTVGSSGYHRADAVKLERVPTEQVIDNINEESVDEVTDWFVRHTDNFSVTGLWTLSSLSGYNGTNSLYSTYADEGTATWKPRITISGEYNVYFYSIITTTSNPDAKITVSHDDGETIIILDQKDTDSGGEAWDLLGSYRFTEGNEYEVTLHDDGLTSGHNNRADTVKFELVQLDFVIDNDDSDPVPGDDYYPYTEDGTWLPSSIIGYNGTTTRYSNNFEATWSIPDTIVSGKYEVFYRHIGHTNSNTMPLFHVNEGTGSDPKEVILDLSADKVVELTAWHSLGEFDFSSDNTCSVTLKQKTTFQGFNRADAIGFKKLVSIE